jgi:hypothetical protein
MLSNSLAFKRGVASKTNVSRGGRLPSVRCGQHRNDNEPAHKYLD